MMVNHIRTLLLNDNGSNSAGANYPLEEYVPPDYQSVKLPFELKKVWQVLFGLEPDRAYMNWRLHQLVRVGEVSNMFEDWFKFDKRATTFGLSDKTVDSAYGKLILTNVSTKASSVYSQKKDVLELASGNSAEEVGAFLAGSLIADDTKGVCYGLYTLETNNTAITATSLVDGQTETYTQSGSSVNGYRPPVRYITNLAANFYLSSANTGKWYVEYVGRPSVDLGTVLANLKNVADNDINVLFSGSAPELKKFKDYWYKSYDLVDQITAVVLGLAYKIEEARIKS
jgi:hypothetical protein